jgi:hypothetical protein
MGHFTLNGLPITIETAAGMTRSGTSADGKDWRVVLQNHYGYVKRTESDADGDHMDVFIGPNPESEIVFVIDQNKLDGSFDEAKCMVGWTTEADAKAAYLANYSPGWKGFAGIKALPIDVFKDWIKTGWTGAPIESQTLHYAKETGDKTRETGLPLHELVERVRKLGPVMGKDFLVALGELLKQQPQLRQQISLRDMAFIRSMAETHYSAADNPFDTPEQYAKTWVESQHHRGQPGNSGQFGPMDGGIASAAESDKPDKDTNTYRMGAIAQKPHSPEHQAWKDKRASTLVAGAAALPTSHEDLHAQADQIAVGMAEQAHGLWERLGETGTWLKEQAGSIFAGLERVYGNKQARAVFAAALVAGKMFYGSAIDFSGEADFLEGNGSPVLGSICHTYQATRGYFGFAKDGSPIVTRHSSLLDMVLAPQVGVAEAVDLLKVILDTPTAYARPADQNTTSAVAEATALLESILG